MAGVMIVTGGGRGIGAATARLAAARGYKVCINYAQKRETAESLFAGLFFGIVKLFWHWTPDAWSVGDRIALVIKDAVFAILPAVLAICIVAAQRLDPSMFVGRTPKPNSAVDINNRFILNTVEQFILYFIGNAGLALYCPLEEARTLIILTILFGMGRVLFWVGYHYNPYVRAFGFGITFYPTVAVYLWLILYVVFGIHVDL